MGLEGVELVLAVEERFGIELPDKELSISTVGDLSDLVIQRYAEKYPENCQADGCAAQRAFYHLRNCLISELSLDKQDIRPDTPTSIIIPEKSRKTTWKRISKTANVKLPDLKLPPVFDFLTKTLTIFFWIAVAVIFISFRFISALPSGTWYGLLFFLLAIFLSAMSVLLIRTFATPVIIPASCSTIGKLSKSIMYAKMDPFGPFQKVEIQQALLDLISKECGIPIEEINRQTTFKELFP